MTICLRTIVGAVSFVALDGLWLGLVMKGFYRDQLDPTRNH